MFIGLYIFNRNASAQWTGFNQQNPFQNRQNPWQGGDFGNMFNFGIFSRECCDQDNLVHYWCSNMHPDCSACEENQTPQPTFSFQEARCECDHVEVEGTPKVGETVTFNAYAKVKDPFMAEQRTESMIFTIFKDGQIILTSPEVKTTGPVRSTDSETGEPIDLYQASLSYEISNTGNYHVDVLNVCMMNEETSFLPFVQKAHASNGIYYQEEKASLWDRFVGFFSNFGKSKNVEGIYDENIDDYILGDEDEPKTLELGTFEGEIPQISTGCRSADFTVYE